MALVFYQIRIQAKTIYSVLIMEKKP